ncbi:uncharacterized protein LOC124290056 [Haliotis rubra]|uniref:uncharacterized protein LOC124290056 n=1 Tax=Haliotis rubra TaxID=36100 RepID=UPI001EE5172A|nr:uncharacterized protein LOC124290056 [Haliotis rubra]
MLRLAAFAILFCGTFDAASVPCNPPDMLLGKFCAAVKDNDVNDDGRVDGTDMGTDLLNYNFDDDPCIVEEWEVVSRWTCRYGYSKEYGAFMYKQFDVNQNGRVTAGDFVTLNFTNADFLMAQYTRFKNAYCGDPKNRQSPVDKIQCDEVDKLKTADIKCT